MLLTLVQNNYAKTNKRTSRVRTNYKHTNVRLNKIHFCTHLLCEFNITLYWLSFTLVLSQLLFTRHQFIQNYNLNVMVMYHNDSHILAYIFNIYIYIYISYVYDDLFNSIVLIKYALLVNLSNIEHKIKR